MSKPNRTPAGISARDFEKIFNEFHVAVYNFFANRGFTRDECFDLTQDTFLAAFRGRGKFRGEASAKTWILAIAANIWRNNLRRLKQKKHHAVIVPIDAEADEAAMLASAASTDRHQKPLDQLLTQERLETFQAGLDALPRQMRLCAYLRYGQEMKYEEIAIIMRTSINTVKSQLHQARERLRKKLSETDTRGA